MTNSTQYLLVIDTPIEEMRHHIDIDFVLRGIVGTASPALGIITSMQEQIEWHLRVASLVVGLLVGIMSLVAIIRKLRGR